jgi:hypothetical protein
MSTDDFVARLHKLRFFEGYSKEAASLAEARIRDQHEAGINGPRREYFERFPGFALSFISLPGEWDYEPYEPMVELVAENSFGMFNPADITDERDPDEVGTATLSFTVDGVRYSATSEECGGWIPSEFLELIEEAFSEHCGNFHFFETFWPEVRDESRWTFCTKRAQKALVKAKLLADHPDDIRDIDWGAA